MISCDVLFTDNWALNVGTQSKLQESLDMFSAACEDFGITVSMSQPTPAVPYTQPIITMGGKKLYVADIFSYLGSTLLRTVTID